MSFWKTAWVVAISVVLVGAQTVFALGQKSESASQECGCCSCKRLNCCVTQPTSAPEPIPATPTRAVSQTHLQFIVTFVSLLLQAPEKAASPVSFSPSASTDLAAVPLYDWNCSYLI